jgi:hypothetical protein
MILNKVSYQVIININISELMTNNISFYCINSKTNLPVDTISTVYINGPILGKSQVTGIIHGIINVENNFSFKVVSNALQGSVVINDTSQITLIKL